MKRFLRSILWKFNYEIIELKPKYRHGALDKEGLLKEFKWLQSLHFKTIIDVGANEGQFSEKMRLLFPSAQLFIFEPLPGAFELLSKNFKNDNKASLFRKGCGAQKGSFIIHQNESSASSSLLQMTDEHTSNFKEAVATTQVQIEIDTLDSLLQDHKLEHPVLLKMDVQGFEDKVIAGATQTLEQSDLVISELSFFELYKGQPLFNKIYELLLNKGFVYCGSLEQLHSPENNKILQQDGIFRRYKSL